VDHDISGRSKFLTSQENVEFSIKVVSVVEDSNEKRGMDFGSNQVARKSLVAGQGFGRNHGGPI